jgi:hypothetical protein
MNKFRGGKPIGVIVHLYMEISQGNSLGSYLYLKEAIMSFFSFFYKIEEEGIGTSGWGEVTE